MSTKKDLFGRSLQGGRSSSNTLALDAMQASVNGEPFEVSAACAAQLGALVDQLKAKGEDEHADAVASLLPAGKAKK